MKRKSASSTSSQESGGSGSGSRGQVRDSSAPSPTTSTSMQPQSTTEGSAKTAPPATLQRWMPLRFRSTTYYVEDFLARASRLLARGRDLSTAEGRSLRRFAESLSITGLRSYSSKTLRDFFLHRLSMRMERNLLGQRATASSTYSIGWGSWGTMSSGRFLTASTGFRRTGPASSLSDILEEKADPRYFLSDKAVKRLLSYKDSKLIAPLAQSPREGGQRSRTGITLLKVTGRHKK